ncbi:hypothetical protein BC830DRAFT_162805 [Chytriomyces sp. MP71]|nr:hypothetical protein BC830DRAFT_162805 [Chytriomyces sp. MP71]
MAVDQSQAFEMATLVRYLSPEAANFALQPASTLCKTLHSSAIYEAPGTAARTVFLLAHLDLAFAFVLSPAAVQDVISIVLDFTEHPTEMALVETGLTLLGKLAHSREVLCVSYVQMEDILLRLWKGSIVRLQAVEYSQLDLFTSLSTLAFCSETAESIESTCLSSHDEYQTAHALALLLDDAVYSRARRSGSGGVSDLTNAIESCKYACLVSLARGLPLASPLVESLLALCAEAARNTSNQVAPLVFAAVRGCLCGLGPPHGVGGLSDSAARSVVALLEGGLQVVLENVGNAKSFVALLREYCGMVFCPTVLASEAGGEGAALRDAVMRSFAALTSLADQKIAIMSFVADPCFEFWRLAVDPASSLRDVALESLHNYLDMFMSLALFGPLRDKNMDAERLDAAVSYAVNIPIVKQSWKQEELYDTQGTAEVNFNCHDYTIRVKGADLLLKLDSTSSPHSEFARCLLEKLLALHNSNKLKAKFDATLEHRMQMRLWCIVHVILDLVIASGTSLVAVLLQAVDVDLLPSTRHYVEWAVIRAILATREFPDVVWSWLDKYELRSTSIVSVMSVLHNVGRFLESPRLFFDTLFVKLLPWLTSNHFTIRLHAQFVAFQAWTRCQSDSSLQPLLENHKALVSMMQFVATNIDCIKHRLQAKNLYFVGVGISPNKCQGTNKASTLP